MSLLPRLVGGEFAPLFRLLDDYASHQISRSSFPSVPTAALRSFQPRFDVRELNDFYELQGELPGFDHNDINIQFTDAQTLSISGRTERHEERGTKPSAIEDKPQAQVADTNNYHKATVEDEATMSGANTEAEKSSTENSIATPSESTVEEKQPGHRYWVSERSVGKFQRTFNFPGRVDQENVKASLKNGILSILVPKAQAPVSRRINIE